MPQGLQVFDAQGGIVLDVSDRLTKIIGIIATTTENGAVAVPVPTWGTVWFQISVPSGEDFFALPRIYYQNGAIHWSFSDSPGNTPPPSFRRAAAVIFGVY